MSCFSNDLTDINFSCTGNIGGIDNFYIIPAEFFSASTAVAGELTAITLSGTHKFSEYKIKPETSNYTETNTNDVIGGSSVYAQTITVVLHQRDIAKRQALLEITTGIPGMVIMIKDALGQYLIFGRDSRKCYLTTNDGGSGTASEDPSNHTLTFTCKSLTPAYFVDDAIVAGLL